MMRKLKAGFGPSYFLIVLVLLIASFFSLSILAVTQLQGDEIEKWRQVVRIDHLDKLSVKGDGVQRKKLHEVHSGPNPIGNKK